MATSLPGGNIVADLVQLDRFVEPNLVVVLDYRHWWTGDEFAQDSSLYPL